MPVGRLFFGFLEVVTPTFSTADSRYYREVLHSSVVDILKRQSWRHFCAKIIALTQLIMWPPEAYPF